MDDASVGAWLNARRKMIVGVLAFAAILVSSELDAPLVLQSLYARLGVYGIHQVAND